MGLDTVELTNDSVIWHRREYNKLADFLVNYTMDLGQDWHEDLRALWKHVGPWCTNLICHSDGGTREGSCSASAWILEAVFLEDGLPTVRPIARGGKYLSAPISSFLAETIALDEATAHMAGLISTLSG